LVDPLYEKVNKCGIYVVIELVLSLGWLSYAYKDDIGNQFDLPDLIYLITNTLFILYLLAIN